MELQIAIMFTMLALCSATAMAHEPGAHVHGIANLQIAVDDKLLTLDFSSPLDNLIGFEHDPRNDQQKAAVQNMSELLHKADKLFIPTAAAHCVLQSVELDSPVLDKKLDKAKPHDAAHEEGGHADLDGEFVFKCERTADLHDMEIRLFGSFVNLRQLDVAVASARGQTAAKLTAANPHISW